MHFLKVLFQWNQYWNFYSDYTNGEKQLRDFIDLDATFRSVNGEPDDFQDISIKDDEIFNDQEENPNTEKKMKRMKLNMKTIVLKTLTKHQIYQFLKKKRNLRPHITQKLEKFSKLFKKFKKLREQFIELKLSNKKIDAKLAKKIDLSEKSISEAICNLFINQNKIDDVVEKHKAFNLEILVSERQLNETAKNLKISEERRFNTEFEKNALNKNWLKNLSKKTNKKWSSFEKN